MALFEKDFTEEEVLTDQQDVATAGIAPSVDYKELYLRTVADLQNVKRRMEREKSEWTHLIQSDVITKVLPVVNDLERAIEGTENAESPNKEAWIEGFRLILKNLKKSLLELGVEEIHAQGSFNPELHEALVHVESDAHASGDIVQVLEKGYKLKGKVIKHARVSVAK